MPDNQKEPQRVEVRKDNNPSDYKRSEKAPQPPNPWANQDSAAH